VLSEFLGTKHAIDAYYPSRKYLPAKVRSFVDLLVEYFRDDATHDDAAQPPGFASITTQTAAPLRPQARIEAAPSRLAGQTPGRCPAAWQGRRDRRFRLRVTGHRAGCDPWMGTVKRQTRIRRARKSAGVRWLQPRRNQLA
jgi:hypothetical protein